MLNKIQEKWDTDDNSNYDNYNINGWHLEVEHSTNKMWLYNTQGLGGSLIIYPDTLEEFNEYLSTNKQVIGFEGNYLPVTIYNKIINMVKSGKLHLKNNEGKKVEAITANKDWETLNIENITSQLERIGLNNIQKRSQKMANEEFTIIEANIPGQKSADGTVVLHINKQGKVMKIYLMGTIDVTKANEAILRDFLFEFGEMPESNISKNEGKKIEEAANNTYKIVYYLNTACAERRMETAEDIEDDWIEEEKEFSSALEACEYVLKEILDHDDDYLNELYEDNEAESDSDKLNCLISDFDNQDWGDGETIIVSIEGPGISYDSGFEKPETEDDDEDYDEDDDTSLFEEHLNNLNETANSETIIKIVFYEDNDEQLAFDPRYWINKQNVDLFINDELVKTFIDSTSEKENMKVCMEYLHTNYPNAKEVYRGTYPTGWDYIIYEA